ncbi:tubulin polyglutamylase TTLL5-like isoform X10 [Mercenaria mercenaria]|uniref:tubulin polyglutamylase TTLL5-like isoform X10 n=1 Tax=Mercenaria mercenaria TaxID=6596 RepID=UPI00234EB2FB|nr:tubulin polyglutamylase TTLL5-like isoform X10 [Mercenaria mercenaria]
MASTKDIDSDGGSFTPSDGSSSDDRSDRDSDYESEEEDATSKPSMNIQWTGYGKKTPVILFNAASIFTKRSNMRTVGERYHMTYKFGNSECKIVRNIFNSHGFHEVHPNSSDYNIVWTGAHLKPFTLRSLSEFQKINHFPRSYELTRKDRLFKNIQRMQQIKGVKNFDIVPSSFVLPGEYQEFCTAFLKDKGPWIVKPVASSRGRGIFLVNHPDQIPLDENIIVCRYISNPLLIDGFKFDVRLYVAVTSYDPLQIYLFEEGLTRFATVKYEKSMRHMRNHCMHLTNYSVNKKNDEYVKNDDADVEDYGNKWSLGAMLRYLRSNGKDTAALMMKIEDVVIKTIVSVELPIATACKMFMPFKGNCFELYGFDIMIDENMKPWVIEVNLSPSLACDSPLDMKIKSNLLCDLFSLTGIICHDPMMRTLQQSKRNQDIASKMAARAKSAKVRSAQAVMKQRPSSAGSMKRGASTSSESATNKALSGLNSDEIRIVRRAKEEESRKGGWVRIFPTADSWDLYSSFLQFTTTNNLMLHQKLYPERHKGTSTAVVSRSSTSAGSRAKGAVSQKLTLSAYIQLANNSNSVKPTVELAAAYAQAMLRTRRYERKLGTKRCRSRRRRRAARNERRKLVQGVPEDSGEDQEENEDEEPPITERNISEQNNVMSQKVDKPPSRTQSEEVIKIVVEKEARKEGSSEKRTGLAALARTNVDNSAVSAAEVKGDHSSNTVENGAEMKKESRSRSPSPPPAPPEPKYNVVELLQKGHSLSKVQARTAFAMYLVRVQQRLMTDCNSMTQDDMDGLNEQMDLVLRFLKRAAVNLQQSFKVVVPSRKLPLNDRRRILAKQLGDFVHIYNKVKFCRGEKKCMAGLLDRLETEQLRARKQLERKHTHLRRAESVDGLDEDKFDRFVHTASEGELEEVLTTYTKINKSASIFLGGKTAGEASSHVPTTGNSMQHIGASSPVMRTESQVQLNRRKDSDASDKPATQPRTVTGWEEVPRDRQIRSRPSSAVMARPGSASSNAYGSNTDLQDPYNDKVISEALQRLTMRQQARQYSAYNGTSLVPSDSASRPSSACGNREQSDSRKPVNETQNINSATAISQVDKGSGDMASKYISMEDHVTKNRPPSGTVPKCVPSAIDMKSFEAHRRKQTNVNLQNANATFNSFIEDTGPNWRNDLALAYNQVTGVTPQNYHTPSQSSKQYQILQQQALKQQSKVLLEQSKAKHQAMIAQAHAVQKSMLKLDRPESEASMVHMYAPKPPVRPGSRKAASAHHRMPRRAVPDETSLNFQFCSTEKSAMNGAQPDTVMDGSLTKKLLQMKTFL